MTTEHIVIVGNGQAGIQLVDSFRAGGYTGLLTIIGDEAALPYQRPPLSKDFMSSGNMDDGDDWAPEALPLRAEKFYLNCSVNSIMNRSVVRIDRPKRHVVLDDGQTVAYTTLVLATGARNRELDLPGADLAGIHGLRTLTDAQALRTRLAGARNVVVIGAGFIGLEFAAVARARGLNVTVLEFADRPMARVLSKPMSGFFAAAHRAMGVDLRLGEGIASFQGENGHISSARGSTGTDYTADLVLVGVGVVPNTELAAAAGLEVANGVVVNASLRTADPNVFALGDCAAFPSQHAGAWLRLESVQNATDQAKHLARTLLENHEGNCDARGVGQEVCGYDSGYAELPWFWSQQGHLKLQIAGLINGDDETVVRGDPSTNKFSVFCFRNGALTGVESVNHPADHMAARRILSRGYPLTPPQAADPKFDIKGHSKRPAPVHVPS